MKNIDSTLINSIDTLKKSSENEIVEINNSITEIVFDNLFIILLSILVICYILYKNRPKGIVIDENDLKNNSESDFGNVFSNLASQKEAKKLKDKLLRKCHPDRFPNNRDLNTEANRLTSLVTKNAFDLNRLHQLEIEIEKKLFNGNKN